MSTPIFSVVICTFNSAGYLSECLESLVTQDAPALEILVVDGGSTDATGDIVTNYGRRHPKLTFLPQGSIGGLARARNVGLEQAQGEYVAFIDADARAHPNWLSGAHEILEQNPAIKAFGGQGQEVVVSPADRYRSLFFQQGWGPRIRTDIKFLYGLNSFYHRDTLLSVGGFDLELLSSGEDVEVGLKLRRHGYGLQYYPTLLVKHARRDDWKSIDSMVYRWSYFGTRAGLKNGRPIRPAAFWAVWVAYRSFRYWSTEWWRNPSLDYLWRRPYHYYLSAKAARNAQTDGRR